MFSFSTCQNFLFLGGGGKNLQKHSLKICNFHIHLYICFLSLTSFIAIFVISKLAILGTQLKLLRVISFVHRNKVYHGTELLQVSGPWVHQWPWTALSRPASTQTCLVTVDMSDGHWGLGQPSVPVPALLALLEHCGTVPLKERTLSQPI